MGFASIFKLRKWDLMYVMGLGLNSVEIKEGGKPENLDKDLINQDKDTKHSACM